MDVLGFALLAGILTVSPGQDTVLVLRNAGVAGAAAGLATTAGVCCGLFCHATLSALGVSALLAASASAFAALRWAGAAYVVWLGLQSLHRVRRGRRAEPPPERPLGGARRSFVQGLLSNVLNANTAVFYLALLPQFAVFPQTVLADSLRLAALHFAMAFVWLGALSLLADRARAWLARPAVVRGVDAVAGVALVAFGLRLALARR
jgi:threonine/homoserine/homoserine lactone efflux protein